MPRGVPADKDRRFWEEHLAVNIIGDLARCNLDAAGKLVAIQAVLERVRPKPPE